MHQKNEKKADNTAPRDQQKRLEKKSLKPSISKPFEWLRGEDSDTATNPIKNLHLPTKTY